MADNNKNKFPIKNFMWFFYVIGWILGGFNLFFWVVELFAGIIAVDKHYFIDVTFHKIVYIWGIIGFILMIFFLSLFVLGFTLPFMMFHGFN